jgi:hypothetical protein
VRRLNPYERRFVETVVAIHEHDYPAFTAAWGSVRPKPAPDPWSFRLELKDMTSRKVLDFLAGFGSFADLGKLTVQREILEGSAVLFLFRAPVHWNNQTGMVATSLTVSRDSAGRLKVTSGSALDQDDPVASLIRSSANEAAKNPKAYRAVERPHTTYRYAIPIEGGGNPGAYPVYLQFSGAPLDVSMDDAATSAAPAPLQALHREYLALERDDLTAFAAGCTSGTRQRINDNQQWLHRTSGHFTNAAPSAAYYEAWEGEAPSQQGVVEEETINGRPVPIPTQKRVPENKRFRFMIDADPVYLLFYEPLNYKPLYVGQQSSSRLFYQYIYKSDSGAYLFTNKATDDLDNLLAPGLFDQSDAFRGGTSR